MFFIKQVERCFKPLQFCKKLISIMGTIFTRKCCFCFYKKKVGLILISNHHPLFPFTVFCGLYNQPSSAVVNFSFIPLSREKNNKVSCRFGLTSNCSSPIESPIFVWNVVAIMQFQSRWYQNKLNEKAQLGEKRFYLMLGLETAPCNIRLSFLIALLLT